MPTSAKRSKLLAVSVFGAAAIVLAGVLSLRGGKAEAQGVMTAPACQCSAPTSIPSMSSTIVHCLCGAMSCVVTEHGGPGRNTNQLQCVR